MGRAHSRPVGVTASGHQIENNVMLRNEFGAETGGRADETATDSLAETRES